MTPQIDIFTCDMLLIPVHLKMHWCLCVVKPKEKSVLYYDSMGRENEECIYVSCCAIVNIIDHFYCPFNSGYVLYTQAIVRYLAFEYKMKSIMMLTTVPF